MNTSLYQINTRVRLTELSKQLGRAATLDDIDNSELDSYALLGFDWLWMLSVWQTGEAAKLVSRSNSDWLHEFNETLPDLKQEDILGSGFAIQQYVTHRDLGGDEALARFRQRLHARGLKLMLDFVPNHMAPDHPWLACKPELFVSGTEADLSREPQNYTRIKIGSEDKIFAFGRDPFFSGWPDTVQLDYSNPETQEMMLFELLRIAGQCDGVRCDMAMLILPEIFERTWGRSTRAFWPVAIPRVRQLYPNFCFLAEVYWDLEWELQQQGFNFTYDKRLYDRLREGNPSTIRGHLCADSDYQRKSARFLENHDEPRAAATFPLDVHKAAAVISFLTPGLRFFHQGQFEGRRKRISPHLVRAPEENTNLEVQSFYQSLLGLLGLPISRKGDWQLLESHSAWEDNYTHEACIAFAYRGTEGFSLLITVNYSEHRSQCYIPLAYLGLDDGNWNLSDQLGDANYTRQGVELRDRGLYLDVAPWQVHAFKFTR